MTDPNAWKVQQGVKSDSIWLGEPYMDGSEIVALDVRDSHAYLIVRAVNSHAALMAALRSAIDCVDEQATVIQELRSGGLATVAIPGWYLDAKKLLEEAAALRAAEPD